MLVGGTNDETRGMFFDVRIEAMVRSTDNGVTLFDLRVEAAKSLINGGDYASNISFATSSN